MYGPLRGVRTVTTQLALTTLLYNINYSTTSITQTQTFPKKYANFRTMFPRMMPPDSHPFPQFDVPVPTEVWFPTFPFLIAKVVAF